jgi:hypothetical protein
MLPPGLARLANDTRADRVAAHRDDGNGRGDALDGTDRQVTERDYHIRPELHQLGGEIGSAVIAALAEAVIDYDVLTLDIAELFQPLAKSRRLDRVSCRSSIPDPADPRDLSRLLSSHRGRPRRRRANGEKRRRA